MTRPNVPGYPGSKLPNVREVVPTHLQHTPVPPPLRTETAASAPELVQFRGRNWNLSVPAVVISAVLSAVVTRQTTPTIPADDSLRRDMRELNMRFDALEQRYRELGAKLDLQEQQTNAVRIDVSGGRADTAVLTRKVDELMRRP